MTADDLYHFKPNRGYWNKYVLPRYPLRKRNKIDTEEQILFEKLQRELFRIINEINDDGIDSPDWKISIACKRRNSKLYIKILYDRRPSYVTKYMVDLQKKVYKNNYVPKHVYEYECNRPPNEGKSIADSEFYSEDVTDMIREFIEYTEDKLMKESSNAVDNIKISMPFHPGVFPRK